MLELVDGYAHVGLPRFQSAEAWLSRMNGASISHSIACPFETCPDLRGVHAAYQLNPERIRAFGLSLGTGRDEVEAGLHAQMDAGFIGFRLAESRLAEIPSILDVVGSRGGIALVVGKSGLSAQASNLLNYLDRYGDSVIVSPHMAGVGDADLPARDSHVRALLEHPRFHVVMTRSAKVSAEVLHRWTEALITHVGWDRLMWGSEAPVSFWRDWTLDGIRTWIDAYNPTPSQRQAFLRDNGLRVIFGHKRQAPQPLHLPYDPFDHVVDSPAPLFPFGFQASSELPARLVDRWMEDGGPERETLADFTSRLLLETLGIKQGRQ